ncbi:hypothetical protein ERO13_D11G270166v2 [Gossypium hirsutum]|nr:hypothetical protein ERO13_D11G270166v2 [Gossypium hirsutum]
MTVLGHSLWQNVKSTVLIRLTATGRQTFGYFGETVAEWAVHVLRDKRRKRT